MRHVIKKQTSSSSTTFIPPTDTMFAHQTRKRSHRPLYDDRLTQFENGYNLYTSLEGRWQYLARAMYDAGALTQTKPHSMEPTCERRDEEISTVEKLYDADQSSFWNPALGDSTHNTNKVGNTQSNHRDSSIWAMIKKLFVLDWVHQPAVELHSRIFTLFLMCVTLSMGAVLAMLADNALPLIFTSFLVFFSYVISEMLDAEKRDYYLALCNVQKTSAPMMV